MDNMIKFYRGLVANLPTTGVNGALYITTDEGAIYYGTGTGIKRLGDFIQVANVAALPEKAHESCLYYCVAENILAKWNGSEWKQINKQPTAAELKTLLGLGSLAYLSEVGEDNLNTALKEKVNAAAEGNHSHGNKTVLDGITAEKVEAWDKAEENAKGYADGLNTAMNTRVEALEAIDHTHGNKELLDTYTQTEENLADAVAKKHEHANRTELDKIVAGDKAKWDAVVADHLTSTDKTTLEDSIGDVNTALGEEVTRAKAAEKANADAIIGIKNGTTINTFGGVETELAKKVDKVEGKSLVLDTEITKLAGVKEGANKVEKSETNGNIKIDGQEVVVYTHPEKHVIGDITGLQDALDGKQAAGNYSVEGHKHVKADITDFAHTHVASEITDLDTTIKSYDYATKTELGDVDKKFENYKTAEAQKDIDDEQDRRLGLIESDYLKTDVFNQLSDACGEAFEELYGKVDENAAAIEGLDGRVEVAEGEIDALQEQIKGLSGAMHFKGTYDALPGGMATLKVGDELNTGDVIYFDGDKLTEFVANISAYEPSSTETSGTKHYNVVEAKEGSTTYPWIQATQYVDHVCVICNHTTIYDSSKSSPLLQDSVTMSTTYTITQVQDGVDFALIKPQSDETFEAGDVIAVGDKEYVFNGTEFVEFGDISAEGQRLTAVEDAIRALQTIDHDAYVAADTALKAELEGKIADGDAATLEAAKADATNKSAGALADAQTYADGKVKALADGQVATNKQDIADLLAQMTWGEF